MFDIPGEVLIPLGYGLDIGGAVLLGLAVWGNPLDLVRQSVTYVGGNQTALIRGIGDQVRGAIGIPALVIGFVGQLCGSVWASISPPVDVDVGAAGAFATVALVLVAVAYRSALHRLPARRLRLALTAETEGTDWLVAGACRALAYCV